jgi:hypothetical protein
MRKKQAAVEWFDALGRPLPKMVVDATAHRGMIKLRLFGVRNVGTRTLHDLCLKSDHNGVTRAEFLRSGLDQWMFMPELFFGCLPPGEEAMFWVRVTFSGMEGSSSRIYVEEGS